MSRSRSRVTGGSVPDAERPQPPTDAAKVDTLLRRYLTGTVQRNDEIREEIRAWFRAQGLTPPI